MMRWKMTPEYSVLDCSPYGGSQVFSPAAAGPTKFGDRFSLLCEELGKDIAEVGVQCRFRLIAPSHAYHQRRWRRSAVIHPFTPGKNAC